MGFFKHNLTTTLDKIAPYKTVKIKQKPEHWFNTEISDLIRQRDNCLDKFRKTKDPTYYDSYKILRNKTQKEIKSAKKIYLWNKLI